MTSRPHSFQSVATLPSSSDGTAGPSVVERSEGPASIAASVLDRSRSRLGHTLDTPQAAGTGCDYSSFPTVRHISRGWTGTLLGFAKRGGQYEVRWHDRPDDIYQIDPDMIEIVQDEPEPSVELRILLLCSATLETLGKLSKELTKLKRETDEAIAKLRG